MYDLSIDKVLLQCCGDISLMNCHITDDFDVTAIVVQYDFTITEILLQFKNIGPRCLCLTPAMRL